MRLSTPGDLWSLTKRFTGALLALWLLVNLLGPWFARDLDQWMGQSLPFGFWVAVEGALVFYLVIIVVYAVAMDHIEQRYLESHGPVQNERDTVAK